MFTGTPQGFTPALQDITTISPDFATLFSTNANISVCRELAPDLALTETYLYTRGNCLPVVRNINLGSDNHSALCYSEVVKGRRKMETGSGTWDSHPVMLSVFAIQTGRIGWTRRSG